MTVVADPTYKTVAEARARFKEVLDGSERGAVTTIARGGFTSAVVEASLLQEALAGSVHANTQIGSEDGRWFAFLEGHPFASDGASAEEALADLRDSLREYAIDWHDHLRLAPNHASNRALVALIDLSDDDQLERWLTA